MKSGSDAFVMCRDEFIAGWQKFPIAEHLFLVLVSVKMAEHEIPHMLDGQETKESPVRAQSVVETEFEVMKLVQIGAQRMTAMLDKARKGTGAQVVKQEKSSKSAQEALAKHKSGMAGRFDTRHALFMLSLGKHIALQASESAPVRLTNHSGSQMQKWHLHCLGTSMRA